MITIYIYRYLLDLYQNIPYLQNISPTGCIFVMIDLAIYQHQSTEYITIALVRHFGELEYGESGHHHWLSADPLRQVNSDPLRKEPAAKGLLRGIDTSNSATTRHSKLVNVYQVSQPLTIAKD